MLDTSKIPTKRVDGYYTHITNCITKIPQDIHLELNDGTLTLKAGSKVYIPNGVGVFDEIVIESDSSVTGNANIPLMLFIDTSTNKLTYEGVSGCFSGNTAPTSAQIMTWFDTQENKVKRSIDKGETWTSYRSLPIGIANCDTSKITSIDQVFNGFGYIGSTIFVLPGVEGIIPNGFNEDGSIKNIHCQIEEVQTKQILNGWNNHWYVHLMGENLIEYHPWELYYNQVDKPMSVGQTAYWYNPKTNLTYYLGDNVASNWQQVNLFQIVQNINTDDTFKVINMTIAPIKNINSVIKIK